jgi:secreted trypsin-like serine protease
VEDGQLCHGDSGGPIFHESKGVERMVGILGGGFGDAWGCKADFNHYRLDKQSTQEWIEEQIEFYFNKK